MGFYASMTDGRFFVSTENTGRVLANLQKQPHRFYLDACGNITAIDISGYLTGNEREVFAAIAPFVRDMSYFKMKGEDGSAWLWRFSGGSCNLIEPSITWEE